MSAIVENLKTKKMGDPQDRPALNERMFTRQNTFLKNSDEYFVQRFLESGDSSYFTDLINRHSKKMRGLLHSLLFGLRDEILDVEQEIVIALWKSLKNFKFQSKFSTYFYRLCCNVAYAYIRKARLRFSAEYNEVIHASSDVAAQSEGYHTLTKTETYNTIKRALAKLSAKDRLIIHLREFDELSVAESAEILGCAEGTVKSKLSRAKMRLASFLKELTHETA